MANNENVSLRGQRLRKDAEATCSRAQMLLAQYRDLAQSVAVAEERVAETMDRLAAQRPADAGHLRGYSEQARRQAALCRQRAGLLG